MSPWRLVAIAGLTIWAGALLVTWALCSAADDQDDPPCPDELEPDIDWPTWEEDEPFGYEAAS